MPMRIVSIFTGLVALFGFRAASKIDETPEEMLKRGFERSYPGWVSDGLLKKPE